MKNKTVAIILAIVALVVVAVFVVKPLLGKTEERTLKCKVSGESFVLPVKIGSVPPYINPKTNQPTLFNAYKCKWTDRKTGKVREDLVIEGQEEELGIGADNKIVDVPPPTTPAGK